MRDQRATQFIRVEREVVRESIFFAVRLALPVALTGRESLPEASSCRCGPIDPNMPFSWPGRGARDRRPS